jgi:hypothetical protein
LSRFFHGIYPLYARVLTYLLLYKGDIYIGIYRDNVTTAAPQGVSVSRLCHGRVRFRDNACAARDLTVTLFYRGFFAFINAIKRQRCATVA